MHPNEIFALVAKPNQEHKIPSLKMKINFANFKTLVSFGKGKYNQQRETSL